MITLRKSSLWVVVAVIGVTLAALAAVILALAGAAPSAPTPTALPGPTDLPAVVEPTQIEPPAQAALPATAAPGGTPSRTPTFAPPPSATPTLPGATLTVPSGPTAAPTVQVVALTQAGPGVSKSFDLPEGLYRVTFQADAGFDLVLPVVEQGDCGSEPLFDGGSGPYAGSATYESSGCRMHFEVDGAGGGWSLGIETISDAAPKSLPLTMKGRTAETSDVVDLPQGKYRVAVENQGNTLVVTPLVIDGECLERPILVATAPGSYQTDYDSAGCRIIFQVSQTDGPWTLTVTTEP